MKILVPVAVELETALEGDVVRYIPTEPIPVEHQDAEVLVVWGNSDAVVEDAAAQLSRLRWVQTLAAGPDQVLRAGFPDRVIVTSGRSLHDKPVTEHALALVLAAARRLHVAARAQRDHRWDTEIGGPQPEHDPEVFTTLRGARVLIWGFGGIARTIAPLLIALGAEVTGVARSARVEGGVRVIGVGDLDSELPGTDVLLMILPATEETRHALGADRIALLSSRSWLVNVGRGSTVDEGALLEALRERRIGGAALDVTEVEPLPAASGLWDLDNVIITPHAAGGRPLGATRLIQENLAHLRAGEPLRNLADR